MSAKVFIAGSGPIAATYAKLVVEAGYNVQLILPTALCRQDADGPNIGDHVRDWFIVSF